jgi:hypothetical protein
MVAAVTNANTAFFMSEAFPVFMKLPTGSRAIVPRERPLQMVCREI